MRSYIEQEILLTYIKFIKSNFTKYKLLIKPLRKLSGFFFYPALMGSKTPTSKFSESKEVRWGINCP
ncbi:hypothetical protein ATN06_13600 [Bacillus thuringiensis]|nr:hypothetical protein ATN06_13600 [Bacillus thuringiensis]